MDSRIRERLQSIPWRGLEGLVPIVEECIQHVLEGQPADKALARLLRKNRSFSAIQRQAVAEAIFGVSLWRRRLAFEDKANLSTFLRGLAGQPANESFEQPMEGQYPALRVPESLADVFSLPDWLAEAVEKEMGKDAAAFAESLNLPGPICFRSNSLKTSPEALQEILLREGVETTPGKYAANALVVTQGRPNIYGLASHQTGLFEVQDEGSQLLGALVEAVPGEHVLDFCAGAGGKTLLMGANIENRGTLWAYDPDLARLDRLRRRAEKAGVKELNLLRQLPPESLLVDKVLVDAPCSELGILRRGPDLRFRISPDVLATYPTLQLRILEQAHRHVLPGGRLVYATCTFRREENLEVAEAFRACHPDFTLVRPGQGWLPDSFIHHGSFSSLPHIHETDGFFAAVFQRVSKTSSPRLEHRFV